MGKAEILQEIKKAEAKVRSMTQEAEEKRKQLQAEGKRKAIEMIDKAEAENAARNDALIASARSDIERRKRATLDEGAKKASTRASNARKRMAEAKEFVLSEFERAIDV